MLNCSKDQRRTVIRRPGTGKTLLAGRAEKQVSVFQYQVQILSRCRGVGVLVRDLFDQAKKTPCIVFIIQIDAGVSAAGYGGATNGADVKPVVGRDGRLDYEGIIIIATNRPDAGSRFVAPRPLLTARS